MLLPSLCSEVPTQIASLSGEIIIHVAAGEAHSLIINDKGELLTFGYGKHQTFALLLHDCFLTAD